MNRDPDPKPRTTAADEVSVVEVANAILRHWRLVALIPVVAALAMAAFTLAADRSYAVSVTFVPQAAETRGAGGAAALAQQFGLNLGGERPGQSPQFFVDLLQSRTVLRQAVESEYRVPSGDGAVRQASLVEFFQIEPGGGAGSAWRKAAERLAQNMTISVVRETGVVRLTVEAPDPALAEEIAERLLHLLNTFNQEVRQARAQEEGRFIGGRLAEAEAQLVAAENALQEFLRSNREFRNSPELLFEHDRLQRQVDMRQEVYTSLLRSQEQARIDGVRDTPLFTVIDDPAGAAYPVGRGLIQRTILAFMFGLILAVFVAFVLEFSRRNRHNGDPHFKEFQGLARKAWDDLRHPRRWVSRQATPVAAGYAESDSRESEA
jgi:uncharacterized protein involved in exopolysaccharide biosynthesis